ncbi:putative Ig domain-containing protein, partial [Xanthomonas perforans]|uniref:putative Ig domain-containing protein n=1 Tax=Xanthomonas perforans TaxID=442694 RepID=UPI0034E076A7
MSSGSLPNGLTLNPTTGVISGTPTADGSFTFAVAATNVAGLDSKTYTVDIVTAPIITSPPPANGTTGVAYSHTVTATGTGP